MTMMMMTMTNMTMTTKKKISNFYYTKSDYLNAICAIMGGYIAEEVVLKKTLQ